MLDFNEKITKGKIMSIKKHYELIESVSTGKKGIEINEGVSTSRIYVIVEKLLREQDEADELYHETNDPKYQKLSQAITAAVENLEDGMAQFNSF